MGSDAPMGFNLFKRLSLRFRYELVNEEPRTNRDHTVNPESPGVADGADEREKGDGDHQVHTPVRNGSHTHGSSTHGQRIDLRDEQPEDGANAERKADYIDHQTADCDVSYG